MSFTQTRLHNSMGAKNFGLSCTCSSSSPYFDVVAHERVFNSAPNGCGWYCATCIFGLLFINFFNILSTILSTIIAWKPTKNQLTAPAGGNCWYLNHSELFFQPSRHVEFLSIKLLCLVSLFVRGTRKLSKSSNWQMSILGKIFFLFFLTTDRFQRIC